MQRFRRPGPCRCRLDPGQRSQLSFPGTTALAGLWLHFLSRRDREENATANRRLWSYAMKRRQPIQEAVHGSEVQSAGAHILVSERFERGALLIRRRGGLVVGAPPGTGSLLPQRNPQENCRNPGRRWPGGPGVPA